MLMQFKMLIYLKSLCLHRHTVRTELLMFKSKFVSTHSYLSCMALECTVLLRNFLYGT